MLLPSESGKGKLQGLTKQKAQALYKATRCPPTDTKTYVTREDVISIYAGPFPMSKIRLASEFHSV